MKAATVSVFALTAASVCAQPIVMPREYYYVGIPRAVNDLDARGWHFSMPHINWHQVGNFAKGAAKIGADILLKRMDEDELYARGFIDKEDLVTRDFDDDYLEARDLDARGWPHINIDWHKVGNFAKGAAKVGAEILLKRMDEDELYARGFIDNEEDLFTRDFDNDYLEARDIDARGWPHINIDWHKVGNFAKGAAKVGAEILFRRMDEDELYARGFIDREGLVTRDFDDDYLEARDLDAEYLEARDFDDDYLEQRDLNFLELRDEQDDGDRRPARYSHRLSRHGVNHKKVGKYSKSWTAKGTGLHAAAARRRPSRPAGNMDDLN